MKSNYDQLAAVLRLWYSDEQIKEIWELLKDYDAQLMDQPKITALSWKVRPHENK